MLRRGRSILCRHTTEGGDQAGRPRLVSASTAYALIAASAQRPGESRWQGQAMNAWPAAWMRRNAAYTVAARAALKSNIPVVRRYRGAAALSARAMCISAGRLARGQRPLPVVVNNVVLFNKSGSARDMMGNNWTGNDDILAQILPLENVTAFSQQVSAEGSRVDVMKLRQVFIAASSAFKIETSDCEVCCSPNLMWALPTTYRSLPSLFGHACWTCR